MRPHLMADSYCSGSLHGVAAHPSVSPAHRGRSEKELIDCRLALSLDDFAAALAVRNIVELEWSSAVTTPTS